MTNKEFLDAQPKGAIITNKKVLSALKRKGLIYGYSQWGYLESTYPHYLNDNGKVETDMLRYLFPNGNANGIDDVTFKTKDEMNEKLGKYYCEIEYMGHKFATKYLDGCFNAYLQKVSEGKGGTSVNPTMSVWGAIV